MQSIKIKVNKVLFTIEYGVGRNFLGYSLLRNNKCLISANRPKNTKDGIKMEIYHDLIEAIGYEVRNEIDKLK